MPQPLEPRSPRQRLADCATLRSFGGRAGPGSLSGLGSCLRRYIVARVAFTAAIGVFEALLFAMLGNIVDWLARVAPTRPWQDERSRLLSLGAVLLGSIGLVALQLMFKQQALASNFPMRLRWNFHRLMLGQAMGFYGDEFAGQVATKVMQTALALRGRQEHPGEPAAALS